MNMTKAGVELSGEQSPEAEARKQRWWRFRVLFGLMFAYLFFYTGRQNFGWALASMNESLGYSMQQLGWISSAGLMAYGFGQFINGNLGDKFGGRVMVTMGGLLSVVLNWITSFGTSYWTIFAPWAVNGYAQSMAWAPGSRMLSNWWPAEQRGTAFGFYLFAAGVFVDCDFCNRCGHCRGELVLAVDVPSSGVAFSRCQRCVLLCGARQARRRWTSPP